MPEAKIPQETRLTAFNYGGRKQSQVEHDRAWGLVLAKSAERRKDSDLAYEATQKLSSIQSLVPDDKDVLEWLGASEALQGRYQVARTHWQKILDQDARHEGALRRLGDHYLAQNELTFARDMFARYLELNPWQGEYQARLAAVYGRLGDFDSAIRCANKALKVNPTLAWAHGILIEIYQRQGKPDEALRHMKLYRKLDQPKPTQR
jgi:tetratricopeptide (TPR) repeat protein